MATTLALRLITWLIVCETEKGLGPHRFEFDKLQQVLLLLFFGQVRLD